MAADPYTHADLKVKNPNTSNFLFLSFHLSFFLNGGGHTPILTPINGSSVHSITSPHHVGGQNRRGVGKAKEIFSIPCCKAVKYK